MGLKLLLLAVFGIAMAHFEGVVVVYLSKALGMIDSESNKESLEKFPKRYLNIEMTREAATIIMLVAIAFLVVQRGLKREFSFSGHSPSGICFIIYLFIFLLNGRQNLLLLMFFFLFQNPGLPLYGFQ